MLKHDQQEQRLVQRRGRQAIRADTEHPQGFAMLRNRRSCKVGCASAAAAIVVRQLARFGRA